MEPSDAVRAAFVRTGHRCECHISSCNHVGHCDVELRWEDYGETWQALPVRGTLDPQNEVDSPPAQGALDYFILCSNRDGGGGCYEVWVRGGIKQNGVGGPG